MVTGRTAPENQMCSRSRTNARCSGDAVSTFLIDDRIFGHACERHIIEVHELAEQTEKAEVYRRGTKTGRVNVTHVPVGTRILTHRQSGTDLMLADTKTGALIATVLGKRKGGGFRCYILTTDLGDIIEEAARCMHTVPSA